jgi:hypothetical protein
MMVVEEFIGDKLSLITNLKYCQSGELKNIKYIYVRKRPWNQSISDEYSRLFSNNVWNRYLYSKYQQRLFCLFFLKG